jgi:hypothetical protein
MLHFSKKIKALEIFYDFFFMVTYRSWPRGFSQWISVDSQAAHGIFLLKKSKLASLSPKPFLSPFFVISKMSSLLEHLT